MMRKTGLNLQRRHDVRLSLFSSVVAGARLPVARSSRDWLASVPDWDALGNEDYGDCVFAAGLHSIRVMAANTKRPIPDYTSKDALALYTAVAGFNPADPSTDVGSDFDTLGAYWQSNGVAGTTIVSRVRVNMDLNMIRLAIDWLGGVFAGVALPDNAETQFEANEPWDLVAGHPPKVENGHEIYIGAYDADEFECVTWGRRQRMKADWLMECAAPRLGGDVQAIVAPHWVRDIGLSPSMLHLTTLQRDADLLLS